ncbi:hypothetical protein C5O10_08730 [Akkermansia muciniphila]|uniref:ankyrin repeat domain-containing protein n=1 Tax=Akkermansia muciniphila TaxID=239935 RepID=UPI00138E91F1|nr:ankyrin repeat domain-containing protein [Akkermansia muciniphila]QHV14412.1 hypothetical protein C5O09_08685 [Akkermansia muciniphila]QHV16883.1 hypothetical protein C5O10_08730 [Akkermansia muciniphila]
MLKAGADVNAKTKDGETALMLAVDEGHTSCVKTLLEVGSDVNAENKNGWTALMAAVAKSNVDCVKVLLEAGADVNAKDKDEVTILMRAALKGHTNCVKTLLKAGADVNAKLKDGSTALMMATTLGHTDCVKALQEAVANVKSKDEGKRKDSPSPEEAQKPVVLQDISSGNLNAGKMSIANIKRVLKDAKEDDQLLLNDLASVVTDLYRSKQEISLVRKQNIKDEKQISSLESWAVSCMTPSALTGRTDPSGAENARRKARILEGAIQQRNTGIRNKLNAIADRTRELESKLRKNGRAKDADMLRKSARYFLQDL